MTNPRVPRVGMRVIKTAVAVMVSYLLFVPFGLLYDETRGGVLGCIGPLYACIACIVCTQSSLGQTVQQGISRFIGVLVGGALGAATLLLGENLTSPWVLVPALGIVCVAGLWICQLIQRPAACAMACIVPCVMLVTGVTGTSRFDYAAARIIETVVGVTVAFLVNAALPTPTQAEEKEERDMRVEVKNTTRKLCVIGDPVLHSKSPVIQNAMIKALGLDYIYLCQPVPRGEAGRWLECAAFSGYAGFNATMPHKEELFPLMDEVDEAARRCGAVNTICLRNRKYYGYNTDGGGFLRALADLGVDPAGKRVILLGSGGAAKAVALALAGTGAKVTVCNRTVEKAEALCGADPSNLTPAGFDLATLCRVAGESDVLVNCTSLGMAGTGREFADLSFVDALPAGAAVCDVIYAPEETALLRRARERGHPAMNGMGMLLHQAILALEHFTGETLDVEAAKAAARRALKTFEKEKTDAI
ncbi:MAG: shikimate dehydrogenase [Pseudoflavonifractor sp.]|nr:shikimate dehydrogenase [Pseudoflavonifractor sp.]